VCARAREFGLPLRLVGRNRDALERLAESGDEARLADARDGPALREAFDGASAVVSLAGPFLHVGLAPVEAAVEAGVHYLDSSGEQAFARAVYERFGEAAARRGVVVLTSFGFDFVVGDLAARLTADALEPLDEVAVAYTVSRVATSAGTRRTLGHVLAQEVVAFERGALVRSSFGATTRRFRFPFGEASTVEWGGAEPLTVPRHTNVRAVRSYVRAPRVAAKAGPLLRAAAPVLRVAGGVGPAGPSERRRARARFAVVAEAHGAAGGRRVTLTGRDVYGLTALALVRGAEVLRAGDARGPGTLAPAEAFDPRELVGRLGPLLRVESVEEL
jgi:short subunit dehydrogenase-like uncharacterized protein